MEKPIEDYYHMEDLNPEKMCAPDSMSLENTDLCGFYEGEN